MSKSLRGKQGCVRGGTGSSEEVLPVKKKKKKTFFHQPALANQKCATAPIFANQPSFNEFSNEIYKTEAVARLNICMCFNYLRVRSHFPPLPTRTAATKGLINSDPLN